MEIIDKTKNKTEEQWEAGDVLKSHLGNFGLIVQNSNNEYVVMDMKESYSIESHFGRYDGVEELQLELEDTWHKVNAKLVIED